MILADLLPNQQYFLRVHVRVKQEAQQEEVRLIYFLDKIFYLLETLQIGSFYCFYFSSYFYKENNKIWNPLCENAPRPR